jgi:hypothetical protein
LNERVSKGHRLWLLRQSLLEAVDRTSRCTSVVSQEASSNAVERT